jgi:hypothetical protein
MGKTGGGKGTNQYAVRGASQAGRQGTAVLDDLSGASDSHRFASRRDEVIYELTLDGGLDDVAGSVDSGCWYGLVRFNGSERTRFGGDAAIVAEDSQGFVDVDVLSGSEADEQWAAIVQAESDAEDDG